MSEPDPADSFIIIGDETPKTNEDSKMEPRPPEMKSMHVVSNVRNRYARTVVTSKYTNAASSAQQATFSIVLPDTAFIAGFVMEIKGKKYEAYVKEKEEAKQEYEEAVSRGRAAALVAVSARDSNNFTVSVNVEPQSDVTFILTYEELLVRKHSKYEMVVNLHLAQLLDDLGVDVYINETRPIIKVGTPAMRSGNEITDKVTKNKLATISKDNNGVVHINFHPTVEQQKTLRDEEKTQEPSEILLGGISRQFVVEYDVERDPLGGEVLVNNGYFVHFFAPTELKPISKHIIFILDVSGSMGGRKLKQLKEAMKVILNELNPGDYFNLIKFSTSISVLNSNYSWEKIDIPAESNLPQSFAVNAKNLKLVKDIIDRITDEGSTNIYDALIAGVRLTSKGISHLKTTDEKHKPQPIIVFLTDGQANVGESDSKRIIEMVESKNDCDNKSAIFTLAFGDDADKEFLKELAIQNSGFLRIIYEAADASLQLQDFYKQISSPLLTNVNFKYSDDVKELTKHKYDILFDGSEFVVAGKVDELVDGFVFVEASTINGINKFCPSIKTVCPKPEYNSLERLWAYMTIKQLLDKKYEKQVSANIDNQSTTNTAGEEKKKTEKEIAEKKALELALKYSFVTPITSLVVVKPDEPITEGKLASSGQAPDMEDAEDAISFRFKKDPCFKRMIKKRKFGLNCYPDIIQLEDPCDINDPSEKIILKGIEIICDVNNHTVSTVEKRDYFNLGSKPNEATFTVELPEKTIFKEFAIDIEEQFFEINGRNEEQAKTEYQEAISNGLNAALVNLKDSNKIIFTVHITPLSNVTVSFKYDKCLENKNGKYEIVTNIEREASVNKMSVIVFLNETKTIKKLNIPPLRSQNEVMKNEYAVINHINENEVYVEFSPSTEQQEELVAGLKGTNGTVSGQFVVEYEVEIDTSSAKDPVTNDSVAVPFPYLVAVKRNN